MNLQEAQPGKTVPGCGDRTPGAAGRGQLGGGGDGELWGCHDSDAV